MIAEGLLFETLSWEVQSVTLESWRGPVIIIPRAGALCNDDNNEYMSLSNAAPCASVAIWDDDRKEFNSTDQVLQPSRLNP